MMLKILYANKNDESLNETAQPSREKEWIWHKKSN